MSVGAGQLVHSEFSGPGNVVLVTADHTQFCVEASNLIRSSAWFRAHFARAQAETRRKCETGQSASMTVPEDSLTLEILLKLACGRPPHCSRLANPTELERVLRAAKKYELGGGLEMLRLALYEPAMQKDALHLYAVADRYGATDLAAGAFERLMRMPLDFANLAHVDSQQNDRLFIQQQHRIAVFRQHVLRGCDADDRAPLDPEYSPRCPHERPNADRHSPKSPASALCWVNLVSATQCAFSRHPSADALEDDPRVQQALRSVAAIVCRTCRLPQYDWVDIRARLSALMDGPDADMTLVC